MPLNDKSSNDSEKPIKGRFSIVAPFLKPAAKSVLTVTMLISCFYIAIIEPASRAAYIQMTGVVVTTFLKKR